MNKDMIEALESTYPRVPFYWRDKDKKFHDPKEMSTRHLFYTFRMIWNHSMPKEARSEIYIKHRFAAFYSQEYMEEAIQFLGNELLSREDLRKEWKDELERFMQYFIKRIKADVK